MSELTCWMWELGNCIEEIVCSRPELPEIRAVKFVRSSECADPSAVYLGSGEEVSRLLGAEEDRGGLTFFSAGTVEGLTDLARRRGVNLVATGLELFCLYERVSVVMHRYQDWSVKLLEAACRRHRIQDVVDTGATLAGGALFLLNAGCRVVFSGGSACRENSLAREMQELGRLSDASVRTLLGDLDGPEGDLRCRALGSEGRCWVQQVFKDNSLISYMVLFAPCARRNLDAGTLLELIRKNVSRAAEAESGAYWAGTDFKVLLSELLSGRLSEEEEIQRRFSLISRIPQQFCSFILVEPSVPGGFPLAPTTLMAQLESIFPDSNAALYDGAVVLLLSRPGRDFQPTPIFDQERFGALLARYDAYAGVSNATSRRSMLRTNYLLTKSILQLGRALRPSTSQRIFFFESYAEYLMIDLCINSFCSLLGHDDIIYLTHPDAVQLYRYDLAHKSNLLEVLYYYCLNNRSISQASQASYMHRNTFAARIKKVQELIKADLSSGELQQRMIFSYKILRYYDRYAKINLCKRLHTERIQAEMQTYPETSL